MKTLFGNTIGLKAAHIRALEAMYRLKFPPQALASKEVLTSLCRISHDIRRQIGILSERSGKIAFVVVGDHKKIMLPDISDYPAPIGRLRGLRYLHTHLRGEPLTPDDLTDLALLRLDIAAAVTLTESGGPKTVHLATLSPDPSPTTPCHLHPPMDANRLDLDCLALAAEIEAALAKTGGLIQVAKGGERAILVSVTTEGREASLASMTELRALAQSSDIVVLDTVIQKRKAIDPRFLLGIGRLEELSVQAMQLGASLVVFNQELTPSQIKAITDRVDLKVIDRTQLILDIFARRANTSEGKLQVELAQLRYLLPRLIQRHTALSRLAGGIGGRGPGETKLETDRRRIRDRITHIEKALEQVKKQRRRQKARREKRGLPVISIIGYTNAGKSTLLNALTKSAVLAESRLFATLDPSSRRLKFPRDREVIITDTVGFIRDLPKELKTAFGATLEELESADLLLHVIDGASPDCQAQMAAVARVLEDLNLSHLPTLTVINKMDRMDGDDIATLTAQTCGIPISANRPATLAPLIEAMAARIQEVSPSADGR